VDFQRLFLFLIFSFSVLLLWDGWQRAQHPVPVAQGASAAASGVPAVTAPTAAQAAVSELPKGAVLSQGGKKITVKTDVLEAEIGLTGGDIDQLEFLQHRDVFDKSKPFVFMQSKKAHTLVAQTGLLGAGLPNHNSVFAAQGSEFQLADGANSLDVRLTAVDGAGVTVTKVYTFHRNSYLIDLRYEIDNQGATPIASSAYFQFLRDDVKPEGDSKLVPTYYGPAVYTEEKKFQKVDFSNIAKEKTDYPKKTNDGWVAMLQHYFVAAWLPKDKVQREFFTKQVEGNLYSAGVVLPVPAVDPGKQGGVSLSLYVGPAQSSLNAIAPGLGLTVDYGWLTVIATPLFWLLSLFQGWVHNWGLAIILLTVLIKLAFFPLSAASYRSMAKMRVVAPKLEKIKQQYSDDRERLHKAMMELYKTEKINPLGGCLPILIQIPVFISLYWAILSSVELRHAPFFGWITDLSSADPYYILPLVMGATMIIQTKLNPTPPDPLQAKMMQIMPIAFSVVFFFFPAGLVLYSVVNNVLSIGQQWFITRGMEKLGSAAKS
jgi:YidC/Oxa1 family membrane protein insertase